MICSFWLVSCLAKAGELERAEALFDSSVGYANDLGLLAEEIDTAERRAARQLPAGVQPHRPDHGRARDRQGAGGRADERTTTSIVIGAGPAGEHCAGQPGGRRPAGGDRRARAGGRRMRLLGLHPLEDAAAPGRGAAGGARGAGRARGRERPARRRRPPSPGATSWCPATTTRAKAGWLERRASSCCAAPARLAGPGRVEVDGDEHAADAHRDRHRLRPGASRPSPACAEARRRVDQPRGDGADRGARAGCSCWAAARWASRWPRRVRRMGASVALVEGKDHVLPREPKPLGEALGERARRRRHRALLRPARLGRAAPRTASTCSSSPSATSCAATACWWPPAGGRASTASASRPWASSPTRRGIAVDARMRAADGPLGDRRRDRHLAAHLRGQVPGPRGGGQHPRPRRAAPTTTPCRAWCSPIPRPPRWARPTGALTATVPLSAVPRTSTYTRAYAEQPRLHDAASPTASALTGAYALGPEAGEWLQQATLGDPRAACRSTCWSDVIQPFPTFSEVFLHALTALRTASRRPPKGTVPLRRGWSRAPSRFVLMWPRRPRAEVECRTVPRLRARQQQATHDFATMYDRGDRTSESLPRHGQALPLALPGLSPDGQPRPPPARDPRSEPRRRDAAAAWIVRTALQTPGTDVRPPLPRALRVSSDQHGRAALDGGRLTSP